MKHFKTLFNSAEENTGHYPQVRANTQLQECVTWHFQAARHYYVSKAFYYSVVLFDI